MNDDLVELSIYIVIIGGALIYEYIRVRKLRKSSHVINVKLGAPFISQFYRPLTPEEREELRNQKITKDSVFLFTVLVMMTLIATQMLLKDFTIMERILITITIDSVIIFFGLKSLRNRAYNDMISPVYKLTGPLSFPLDMSPFTVNADKQKFKLNFNVGSASFSVDVDAKNEDDPSSFYSIFKSFGPDELVEVEYTPIQEKFSQFINITEETE